MNKNALLQRIRRSLKKDQLRLIKASIKSTDYGSFLIVDNHNLKIMVIDDILDLAYERKLLRLNDSVQT